MLIQYYWLYSHVIPFINMICLFYTWAFISLSPLTYAHITFFGRKTLYASYSKEWEVMLNFFENEDVQKFFEILLHGRFVSLFPFTYLSSHLFTYIWTHGYLFHALSCNPILFYLFVCLFIYSFIYLLNWCCFCHWELSVGFRVPWHSTLPKSVGWIFCLFVCFCFEYFLTL